MEVDKYAPVTRSPLDSVRGLRPRSVVRALRGCFHDLEQRRKTAQPSSAKAKTATTEKTTV